MTGQMSGKVFNEIFNQAMDIVLHQSKHMQGISDSYASSSFKIPAKGFLPIGSTTVNNSNKSNTEKLVSRPGPFDYRIIKY